jgi:hypothetical protein
VVPVYPVQGLQAVVLLSELAAQLWLPATHMPAGRHDWFFPAVHWQ